MQTTWGVFIIVSQYDALKVGEILDGLAGAYRITDVPPTYLKEEIETLIALQGLHIDDFSGNYHSFVVLPYNQWSDTLKQRARFARQDTFDNLVKKALAQLTKVRQTRFTDF